MSDWEKSGQIASEALDFGKNLIKEGKNALEVLNKIEKKINELGGKPAFPAQISINETAAHCIPEKNVVFKEGDLVKLDVGAHVNGCIGDNAVSINFGDHDKLIKASRDALNSAIEIAKIGTELREIGNVVNEVMKSYEFNVIKNLSGHEIKEYETHAGLTVPNYDDGDRTKLKEGQVIAIEPFATTGVGFVKEGKPSGIYSLINPKQVRNDTTRNVLKFILEEYSTLPFAQRWLSKKFSEFQIKFALRMLEKEGIIQEYKQLIEKGNGIVSQSEHTLMIGKNTKILTKR
ncbi:type II methionyl aminopeptidase [archaeon]|nr:type II methionyl aminopeptidase [archaeon]